MSGNSSTLVLLLCVVIGLLALPRLVRAQQDPDSQVIAELRQAGSDLSKPHQIEFFLYVPTREAADRLASRVRALKFEAKVDRAALGSQWLVLATKSMIPKGSDLVSIRKQFTALAAAEQGEYDGWGSPVLK